MLPARWCGPCSSELLWMAGSTSPCTTGSSLRPGLPGPLVGSAGSELPASAFCCTGLLLASAKSWAAGCSVLACLGVSRCSSSAPEYGPMEAPV